MKSFVVRLWTTAYCAVPGTRIKSVVTGDGPVSFAALAIIVLLVQFSAFTFPVLGFLPCVLDARSFLMALWQVHASVVGLSIIVVTILVTVIASEKDRNRTWKLYAEKTRFLHIVWFNLVFILSAGLATLQAYPVATPLLITDRITNLVLSEALLFTIAVLTVAWLFTVTLRFLDDDYVENLAERRILRAMPDAVNRELQRLRELLTQMRGEASGS